MVAEKSIDIDQTTTRCPQGNLIRPAQWKNLWCLKGFLLIVKRNVRDNVHNSENCRAGSAGDQSDARGLTTDCRLLRSRETSKLNDRTPHIHNTKHAPVFNLSYMDASVSTGFQIVTRKGRKQSTTKGELQNSVGAGCPTGGRKVKKTTCNCLFSDTDEGSTVDSKELKDKPYHTKVTNHIEVCRSELVASTFWTEIQETFCCKQQCRTCKADDSDPDYPREEAEDDSVFQHKNHKLPSNYQDIVCYGIGNISCSPIARYQFAFLLMLVDFLKPQGNCYIYDPILAPLERRIATEKGLLEIEKNEECEREAKGKTLFFMIHCGKSMYNNVLKANWGLNLENVVLVGNSFKNYEERLPSRQLKAEAPYIYSILPYTTEIPVMNSFHHDDIFNDTSFHIFMRELLRTAPDSLWTERYESCIIDDSEIISKEKIKTYTGEM